MFPCVYVVSGSLNASCGEQSAQATAGQLVLMDCRLPYRYYVTEPTELLWFHFAGGESAAYVRLLTEEQGICFDGNREVLQHFERIFCYGNSKLYNEHRISLYIQSVLCCLAAPEAKPDIPEVIRPAAEYIAAHFREEVTLETLTGSALSIEQIAEQSGFNSASHFSRVFRRHENMTPSKFRSMNF